jgi:3',5'-cyclic AMP phosphodiesterase CpdA
VAGDGNIPPVRSFFLIVLFLTSSVGVWKAALAEQAQAPAPAPAPRPASPPEWKPPALVPVRPIRPPARPLPLESASAAVTRFSFIAYGDTRCDCRVPDLAPPKPEVETDHAAVVDTLVAKAKELSRSEFPVRFVLQSGDATYRGRDAERWNDVFIPIAERITQGANLPYFFVPGNHDVTSSALPPTDPDHALGLHNTLSAISKLIPPEGSPRRLSGYATFSFGYGNMFVIGLDSNIAGDLLQLAWVADQLERLDRTRYAHVVVVLHHPPITSGRYSGVPSTVVLPNGLGASGGAVAPEALAIQRLYMPLFRKHHVRLVLAGHDHLFDHWVERYTDGGRAYRLDHIVSGGGGAPSYIYTGEPDLKDYLAAGAAQNVRLEHLARPEATVDANPNHFLVIQVDGQKLTVEVVASRGRRYMPYNGQARMELSD